MMLQRLKRWLSALVDGFAVERFLSWQWRALTFTGDPRIEVGRHVFGLRRNMFPVLLHNSKVKFGNFSQVAQGAIFILGQHHMNTPSPYAFRANFLKLRDPKLEKQAPDLIIVGNDVSIATRAMILSGVTIGDGAFVGAGAVVVKDVPPYAVVAGVPAQVVKMKMRPDQIEKMLKIAWWDWPDEKIKENVDLFYGDVDTFIETHYRETD